MNRKLAIEWLRASYSDLVLIAEIIDNDTLRVTNRRGIIVICL